MKESVAFLDSGVGGISILREAVKLMPNENFIYFGDSKNAPYGTKPTEEIFKIVNENVEMLIGQGAKAIVIACNTATGAAARALRLKHPTLPVVGIEPAIKPAVLHNIGDRVLVMATPLTLKQDKFLKLLDIYKNKADIQLLPCDGLMEFVENGILTGDNLHDFLKNKIDPVNNGEIKAVVLGCTHYPFVQQEIVKAIGYPVEIDDGTVGTAKEIKRRLEKYGCSTTSKHPGTITFLNSSNKEGMLELSKRLFNL